MIRLPVVDCKYGAPMGRDGYITPGIADSGPIKLHLQRVTMTGGGAYDSGGAYWGCGEPLWRAWLNHARIDSRFETEQNIRIFVRAGTRRQAKRLVLEEVSDATDEPITFYR